jgi:uncharacterized cupin superfamily protein
VSTYNLFDGEVEASDPGDPEGFRGDYRRIGPIFGASLLGATVYQLHPGDAICPYHYEYPNEEWLFVLSGRPTLRTPGGERELRAGDIVCFPSGPEGAHAVANRTEETLRVLMISTKEKPDVSVYPDSDKLGVWPVDGGGADHIIVRRESSVDYWDREL